MFKENHPDRVSNPSLISDKKTGSPVEAATEDTDFIRCRKCRFILDRKKVSKGSYDGLSYESITQVLGALWDTSPWGRDEWGGLVTLKTPVVRGGCPFCGSYNYD